MPVAALFSTWVRRTSDELARWMGDVQTEDIQAQQQLKRLEAELKEILPASGYDFDLKDHRDANVVARPKPSQ